MKIALALGLVGLLALSASANQILLRYPALGAQAIAADKSGNLFTVGSTATAEIPGVFHVNKLDSTGAPLSTFDFPASGEVTAATTDAQGNLIFVGVAGADGFTQVSPAYTGVTGASAFVVKVDPQLHAVVFSMLIATGTTANAVTTDAAGNIYVAGSGAGVSFPVTLFAYHTTAPQAAFVMELSPDGAHILTSTQFGGSKVSCTGGSACIGAAAQTGATSIAVDSTGAIVLGGSTTALDLPVTAGTPGQTCGCTYNQGAGFVAKLSPRAGQLLWSTFFPNSNPSSSINPTVAVDAIALDAADNLVVGGAASAFATTAGSLQPTAASGTTVNGFLAKLSSDGTQIPWATYVGGNLSGNGIFARVNGIAVNAAGEIAVTGSSDPTLLPAFAGTTNFGNTYAARLTADGSALKALYIGPNNASGLGLTLTPAGNLATIGQAGSLWIETPSSGPSLFASGSSASGPVASATSPYELISFYGAGIGPQSPQLGQVVGGAFTTSLGGYSVAVNGNPAPLLYVSSTQINAIVPKEVSASQSAHVVITTPAGTADGPMLTVQSAHPYTFLSTTTGLAAAFNQDGSLNSPANPAKYGSIVTVYATGGTPAGWSNGQIVPATQARPYTPAVTVLGIVGTGAASSIGPLEVEYAGDAPDLVAGAMQINFRIPSAASSPVRTYSFQLQAGNIPGGTASIAVTQ